MKNSVNLNSTEWCDIIFEGKNKEYGAFALRQSSWKRHLIAFGLIVLFTAFVAALPAIISTVQAATKDKNTGIDETRIIDVIDDRIKEKEEILEPKMTEPPKFAEMKKFVPPTITTDDQASDPTEMTTMEDAANSKGFIGAFNVEGTKDPEGVFKNVATDIMGGDGSKGKGEPTIYNVGTIQVNPQFPGGEAEMYAFIKKNLNYPTVDQEMGNHGRVALKFVVSKTGEITNIQLVKGVSPGCDKEAMRVLKSMPKWIPGRQNGEPVNVYFIIPIVFRLGNM